MTERKLIIDRLKTHATVKNVVPFGTKTLPTPPYVVVTIEPTDLGYTRARVNAHYPPDNFDALELYTRKDTYNLLSYQVLTSVDGRRIYVEPIGIGPQVTSNTDTTISQEAVFRFAEIPF